MAKDVSRETEDVDHDDVDYTPAAQPKKSAKAWLNLLEESEKAFEDYNNHCDKIEKRYANMMRLSAAGRDREFQMFWSNIEVLKPSIYARPPQPAVAPKFRDRRPVPQAAAEMLERCCTVAFDLTRINDLMMLLRDDVAILNRGVAWCRYESGKGKQRYDHEKVCIDFKNRRDFLHSLSRNWREVTWVAAASYLTRREARKRFAKYSGDEYQTADYKVDRDTKEIGGTDGRERAKFWEIWNLDDRRVVWVAEGCENILDEDDPHLDLQNFFPCPKPAYGTCQPGSLVPVPDVLQYEDQLQEINLLTNRIHALSDALEVRGFYPAGTTEIAEAVQAAVAHNTPGRVLVPISNWAAFGGTKEVIIWLPIEQIAQTITALVMLRKEIINDIYQIMGLSDIMRGSTDPSETLGAQQLKTQFGGTRIRDKQQELVRIARDLVEICSDIITEKFDPVTMIEMSQTDLETAAMRDQKVQKIQEQLAQAQQMAQKMLQAPGAQQQANPQTAQMQDQFQQAMQAGQMQIKRLMEKPTIEQVFKFLSNHRSRAFVLDIETDSTIQLDENAEKQRRSEFVQMLGVLIPQLAQMVAAEPATAGFTSELLKFSVAPFRAGRSLDGAIDALADQAEQKAQQPRGDDPTTAQNKAMLQVEQMKDQTAKEKIKADADLKAQELAQKDEHKKLELQNAKEIEQMRLSAKQGDNQGKALLANQKAMHDREEHQMDVVAKQEELASKRVELGMKRESMQMQNEQRQQDAIARRQERAAAAQFKQEQQRMRPPGSTS